MFGINSEAGSRRETIPHAIFQSIQKADPMRRFMTCAGQQTRTSPTSPASQHRFHGLRLGLIAVTFLLTLTSLLAPAADIPGRGDAAVRNGEGDQKAAPLRFFALGDVPYGRAEVAPMQRLLDAAAAEHPPFIVHLGDIKGGSTPCTDAQLQSIAGIFRALPMPVVYTPGDNEWTDCHRKAAGGLDPRERLARLRDVFFGDPSVLRLAALGAQHAGDRFPEIYRFIAGDVLFVALHVVGGSNGLDADDPPSMTEFKGREAANRAFLMRSLEFAKQKGVRALVLMIQADPLFERGRGPDGFRSFKEQLITLMGQFSGPVLLLHGDTHQYRHDHPLLDPARGTPFERLTRVEVPGSPVVGGLWITVDPGGQEPFTTSRVDAVSLVVPEAG